MQPLQGWRQVAPVDCVGLPAISIGYQLELIELASQAGLTVPAGATLTATYEQRDGQWWPVPDTLKVLHPGQVEQLLPEHLDRHWWDQDGDEWYADEDRPGQWIVHHRTESCNAYGLGTPSPAYGPYTPEPPL